jgi:hypothetical protein
MLPDLLRFRRNVYSQNGEDGVLRELLRRLNIEDGWFCEFGAWDGKYLSNSYLLLQNGWKGVMIEGDPQRYLDLQETAAHSGGRLHTICRFVGHHEGVDSLDSLLSQTPIPSDFDVLSIDVDGLDYFIWEALEHYSPKIVIIEVNSHFPPGVEHVEAGENPTSSFSSMVKLGLKKGYIPVIHTGNIFFVRKDIIQSVSADDLKLRDYTNQFTFTDQSARGSVITRLTRLRQRVTDRLFYSHLRDGRAKAPQIP